jgi:hypothetical protein
MAVQRLSEAFYLESSFVQKDSFFLRNPLLRQAAKRSGQHKAM